LAMSAGEGSWSAMVVVVVVVVVSVDGKCGMRGVHSTSTFSPQLLRTD
jgi:hypothetical protein